METWSFRLLIDFAFELPVFSAMCSNRDKRESRENKVKNQVKPFCLLLSGLIPPVPAWASLWVGSSVCGAGLYEPFSLIVHASVGWVPCLSLPHVIGLGSRAVLGLGSGIGFQCPDTVAFWTWWPLDCLLQSLCGGTHLFEGISKFLSLRSEIALPWSQGGLAP